MRQLVNRQLRSPRGHETGCNSLRRTPLGRAIQKAPRLQQFSTAPPPRAPLAPCAATPQLAAMALDEAAKKAVITDSIRGIPDFPHKGILFWDVTTIMLNHEAFKYTIELFAEHYKDKKVDVIAGFEARGLIFGAPLALALGAAFVPLRKPGKLPGEKISEEYKTEYSTDKIEMHVGAIQPGQRVVLVDDLIATGGTLAAGIKLVKKAGGEVVEAACVIELPFLKGRDKIPDTPLFVLVEKEGL